MRPPAVPLVVHDPYFSIWSFGDKLAESWPRHWTGAVHALCSMVRIDGKTYRIMGLEPKDAPAMEQTGLQVLPTRTIYDFEAAGVARPAYVHQPAAARRSRSGRPAGHVSDVGCPVAIDEQQHEVSLYFDNSAELVVNEPKQQVVWSRPEGGRAETSCGSARRSSPCCRRPATTCGSTGAISTWPRRASERHVDGASPAHENARSAFAKDGRLPEDDDMRHAASGQRRLARCRLRVRFGQGRRQAGISLSDARLRRRVLDRVSRHEDCGPIGGATAWTPPRLLQAAAKQYDDLSRRCEAFDRELMADLTRVGGAAIRRPLRAGLSPGDRRPQAGRRARRPADALPQGVFQQRLHLHGGRDLPGRPDLHALEQRPAEGVGHAGARLRRHAAVEVPLRPARPGDLSEGQRPGLRRRRADRKGPDAGRGVGQHADPGRGDLPDATATRTTSSGTGRCWSVGRRT